MAYDAYDADETAFHKTLASDIDDATSLALLNDVYETDEMWHEFQDEEIQQVVEVFSILKMAPGEKLITKGEYATFCGIVLQGTFSAVVSPTFTVALTAGSLVGEMSLFEGGTRNADIITGTDACGCILAVITFVDLDNLTMNERYAALARKLTMLFATASIKKLRAMIKPADATATATTSAAATPQVSPADAAVTPAPAPLSPSMAASAAASAPAPTPTAAPAVAAADGAADSAAPAAAAAAGAGAAAVAAPTSPKAVPAKKERGKKAAREVVAETLYKNKLSKAAASAASASSSTFAPGSVGPDGKQVRAANINEAQRVLEEQQYKLQKVEHAKRTQQVILDRVSKQVKAAEEKIREHELEVARLSAELRQAAEANREETAKRSTLTKSLEEMTAELQREHAQRLHVESRLTMTAAELGAKMEAEITRLTTELRQIRVEKTTLDESLAAEQAAHSALRAASEAESARLGEEAAASAAELERLSKELGSSRTRLEALETELRSTTRSSEEQKVAMAALSSKIVDLEEKLAAAVSWKSKALEFQSGLDAEKKRHVRLSDEWSKKERALEQSLRHYKLLLKTFVVTIYAKEWRLRRLLGALHRRVSDLLLTTLEEHHSTATGKEKAKGGSSHAGGGGALVSGSGGVNAATFKSVRRRKKQYLDQLLRPTSKLRDVVLSLDDEVAKLRAPFEEIRERCLHWRATSESFFQRNIDLASRLMTLDRSLTDTAQAKETLSTQAQRHTREYERLQQKNADLSARVQSGGTSNNGGGGSETSRDSHSAKAVHSKTAELEQLEARCTVLRAHIPQLEQHYLSLQAACHQAAAAAAAGAFGQESKEQLQLLGGPPPLPPAHATPTFHFDPSLVSPVPFPPPQPAAAAAAAPPSGSQSARGAGPHGASQPHSYAYGYGYGYGYPTYGGYPAPSAQSASPSRGGGPGAPGGGYLFGASGTASAAATPRHAQQPQQQTSAGRLPAVAGAQPSPSQQAPILLSTPQRPTLTFAPR